MRKLEKLGILISSGICIFVKEVPLLDLPLTSILDKITQVLVLRLNFLVGVLSIGFMITDTGIIKMVVGREYNEKVVTSQIVP
jgi:hypothetical protein